MQQRQLRLGDILDDYCPRERRVTNHAVVAMVGAAVKQTRCTTCDAEHEYKGAKVPVQRKKKDAPSAPSRRVLTGQSKSASAALPAGREAEADPDSQRLSAGHPASSESMTSLDRPVPEPGAPDSTDPGADQPPGKEEGPVHRPLIRATLPRTEGTLTRQMPEFTIRQNDGRPGRFRTGAPHRSRVDGGGGSHTGGGARHAGRHDIQAGRGGNRVLSSHQQRPAHHPHARVARPGKKRPR